MGRNNDKMKTEGERMKDIKKDKGRKEGMREERWEEI